MVVVMVLGVCGNIRRRLTEYPVPGGLPGQQTGLRLDLDRYLRYYNTQRAHTGRWHSSGGPWEGQAVAQEALMCGHNSGTGQAQRHAHSRPSATFAGRRAATTGGGA
jgi:hypothetical protein